MRTLSMYSLWQLQGNATQQELASVPAPNTIAKEVIMMYPTIPTFHGSYLQIDFVLSRFSFFFRS